MKTHSEWSTTELADRICQRAGQIAAAQSELLLWIAEFDRREGWAGPGLLSCAHWLSWRIGLNLGAAREQVRVGRRLEDLPQIAEAFAAGRLSYSKVRAITRIAEPEDGVDWVALGRHSSAAQLENVVRGMRRAKANEEAIADPEAAAWSLRTRVRYDDNGNFSYTISGPAELLPMIQAGIEAKRAELQRQRDAEVASAQAEQQEQLPVVEPAEEAEPRSPSGAARAGDPAETSAPVVTSADALVALAQDALTQEQTAHPEAARRRRPQLNPQIDPLSGWARQSDGELLPPSSLGTVMKSLPGRGGPLRLRPVTAADLRRHDLGRSTRQVSTALRELLGVLDGERCRFPGCTQRKKLHAHHVEFWSADGQTDLANLVLVCSRHHTLIHTHGFGLVLHPDRRLDVTTADGTRLLHHPAAPWGDPAGLAQACGQVVSAEALPPDHCDARINLGWIVSVLLAQAA